VIMVRLPRPGLLSQSAIRKGRGKEAGGGKRRDTYLGPGLGQRRSGHVVNRLPHLIHWGRETCGHDTASPLREGGFVSVLMLRCVLYLEFACVSSPLSPVHLTTTVGVGALDAYWLSLQAIHRYFPIAVIYFFEYDKIKDAR